MDDRNDRRKEARKKLMAFTPVYDQRKDMLLGYIRDLTMQGVLVIGEKALSTGTQTILSIELPGGLPGITSTQMTISARVARCEQDKDTQTYNLGFEFNDLRAEQVEIIQALLERYHFRHKLH